MNAAFDYGSWLPSPPYRVYAKSAQIVNPSQTFVFTDEHPDSINDGSLAANGFARLHHPLRLLIFPPTITTARVAYRLPMVMQKPTNGSD